MGIYDREYYRKEGPSFLGSWAYTGSVCKWLVIVNVIIYIVQLVTLPTDLEAMSLGWFTNLFAMQPAEAFYHLQIWRFVTGAFLHVPGDYWHIIINMLILWFFGRDLEELYGHGEFLAFYLVAGIVGNLFYGLSELWVNSQVPAMGASGAVLGVVVLATMHFPYRTFYFFFVLPIPLWVITVIYVAVDLFTFIHHMRQPGLMMGVAVAAHLGGAGFGFLYYKLQWRLLDAWSSFRALMSRTTRPRLRIYREEEPAVSVASARSSDPVDEQLEARADAVLEKVSREGMASLTPEERDILQKASEQYKKRKS